MIPEMGLVACLMAGAPVSAQAPEIRSDSGATSRDFRTPSPPPIPSRLARSILDAHEVRAFLIWPQGPGTGRPLAALETEAEVVGVTGGWLVRERGPKLSASQARSLKSMLVDTASFSADVWATSAEPLVGYLFEDKRDTVLVIVGANCARAVYQISSNQIASRTTVRGVIPVAVSLAALTRELFPTDPTVQRACEEAARSTEMYEEVQRAMMKLKK